MMLKSHSIEKMPNQCNNANSAEFRRYQKIERLQQHVLIGCRVCIHASLEQPLRNRPVGLAAEESGRPQLGCKLLGFRQAVCLQRS